MEGEGEWLFLPSVTFIVRFFDSWARCLSEMK